MRAPEPPGPVTQTPEWEALLRLAAADGSFDHIAALHDEERNSRLVVEECGLRLDLTRQRLPLEALEALIDLALRQGVPERIAAMLEGAPINTTEGRSVLHTALRIPAGGKLTVDGVDIAGPVHSELRKMAAFAEAVRSGKRTGHSGRRIDAVVNLGIGGSNLGPQMATAALRPHASPDLEVRFASNVDPADLDAALTGLDPHSTMFIVCSKTFTTQETLANARAARDWLVAGTGTEAAIAAQMVAVSTAAGEVGAFGIDPEESMFGFWEWVGGRYSIGSAIGLSLMVAIGPAAFGEFLAGMHELDLHLASAPPERNLAWLLALTWFWNGALLGHGTVAVLPYAQDLHRFPAYLQQLDMESNGKRVRLDGSALDVESGPVVWGEPGTDSQHSFHQLLHQGTRTVPCDLIGFARSVEAAGQQRQDVLVANMIAQVEALSIGRAEGELAGGGDGHLAAHRACPGGRPVTVILAERLDPRTLGRLIALYEHKVLIEGAIRGIDSFDQWGVELGKQLAGGIGPEIESGPRPGAHDPSTTALIEAVRSLRAG